jgi:hypothetical protein
VIKIKTLRVDLTRICVKSTRSMAQLFSITRIRVESTGVWLNESKNNIEKINKKLSTTLVPVDLTFMCIMSNFFNAVAWVQTHGLRLTGRRS